MYRILVTGAAGSLGSDLCESLEQEFRVVRATRKDFDITDLQATRSFVLATKPDAIIHPAAFTDVDGCERQQNEAFMVNGLGTRNIAIAVRNVGAKLFYISTDYVFDGAKVVPYREYDSTNPQTIYGKSKLMGEQFVKEQLGKFFIIRIAWLYGKNGNNFVKTMLKLAQEKEEIRVVNDQRGSPTWTMDIARQIKKLLPIEVYGTYHCTAQGSCSWYEFALEIFKFAGYEVEVYPNGLAYLVPKNKKLRTTNQDLTPITLQPVKSDEFSCLAARPQNSVLENYILKLQGLDIMPHWKESLHKFMKAMNRQQSAVNSQQPKG